MAVGQPVVVLPVVAQPAQAVPVQPHDRRAPGVLAGPRVAATGGHPARALVGRPGLDHASRTSSGDRRDRQVVEEDLRRPRSPHQVHDDPLEVRPFQAHRTPRRGPEHPGLPLDRRQHGWSARAAPSGPPGRRSCPGSGRRRGPGSRDRCPPEAPPGRKAGRPPGWPGRRAPPEASRSPRSCGSA